jgi:hypothetical protein
VFAVVMGCLGGLDAERVGTTRANLAGASDRVGVDYVFGQV